MRVRVSDFVTALGVAVLLIVVGTLAPAHAALIQSTFDNDLEHWTVEGGKCSWQKSDDKHGGYLQAIDTDTLVAVASKAFIGDLSKYDGGTLSFDARLTGSAKPDSGFGTVTLWSKAMGLELKLDLASGDITEKWATYSASFDAKTWGLEEEVWLKFISYISSITLNLETHAVGVGTAGEVGTVGVDNFRLKSVPEPASLLLLGIGMVGVFYLNRRRWRRRV